MPARNALTTGVGMRFANIWLRDPDDGGILIPTGQAIGTGWPGYTVSGAQALTVNMPEAQRIAARGDDVVFHTFTLPPTEGLTGQLRVAKDDLEIQGVMSGLEVFGSAPWKAIMQATDMQGYEPDVIIHGQQRGINSDKSSQYFGQTVWRNYFLLNANGQLQPASMEDQQVTTITYSLVCNQATVNIYLDTLTDLEHGCLASAMMTLVTLGRLRIEVFKGDGSETAFVLSTSEVLYASGHYEIWVDGARDFAPTLNETTKTVTFSPAPSDGAKIVVAYQLA